jgi:hypothetical protein
MADQHECGESHCTPSGRSLAGLGVVMSDWSYERTAGMADQHECSESHCTPKWKRIWLGFALLWYPPVRLVIWNIRLAWHSSPLQSAERRSTCLIRAQMLDECVSRGKSRSYAQVTNPGGLGFKSHRPRFLGQVVFSFHLALQFLFCWLSHGQCLQQENLTSKSRIIRASCAYQIIWLHFPDKQV